MADAMRGVLEWFIETGYEGPPWAFQDSRWIHTRAEPCWDPEHCILRQEDSTDTQHYDYQGLHLLAVGDRLTVRSKTLPEVIVLNNVLITKDLHDALSEYREMFWEEWPAELVKG